MVLPSTPVLPALLQHHYHHFQQQQQQQNQQQQAMMMANAAGGGGYSPQQHQQQRHHQQIHAIPLQQHMAASAVHQLYQQQLAFVAAQQQHQHIPMQPILTMPSMPNCGSQPAWHQQQQNNGNGTATVLRSPPQSLTMMMSTTNGTPVSGGVYMQQQQQHSTPPTPTAAVSAAAAIMGGSWQQHQQHQSPLQGAPVFQQHPQQQQGQHGQQQQAYHHQQQPQMMVGGGGGHMGGINSPPRNPFNQSGGPGTPIAAVFGGGVVVQQQQQGALANHHNQNQSSNMSNVNAVVNGSPYFQQKAGGDSAASCMATSSSSMDAFLHQQQRDNPPAATQFNWYDMADLDQHGQQLQQALLAEQLNQMTMLTTNSNNNSGEQTPQKQQQQYGTTSCQQQEQQVAGAGEVQQQGSRRASGDRGEDAVTLANQQQPALQMMFGGPCQHCSRLGRSSSVAGSSGTNSVTASPKQPKLAMMNNNKQQQSVDLSGGKQPETSGDENAAGEKVEQQEEQKQQDGQKQSPGNGNNNKVYPQNPESPSHQSLSNESVESVDSGRDTGGPLTSCSPFNGHDAAAVAAQQQQQQQAAALGVMDNQSAMYEFEIPNTLVGLIIGIGGKTIKELCTRTDTRMLIRPHHTVTQFDTHQICSIQGHRDNINKCLHMIRYRFPPCRFPDLNLKPVIPPPPVQPAGLVGMPPTALTLPVGVPCEAYISAPIDAGHFFVQLPTHPSWPSLATLDQFMLSVYSQPTGAPELPKPCGVGVLCAAPTGNGWFRALTLAYDEEMDETMVRFVDYGGFARIPRADLRQIRTDFMSLSLQAIQCYLANVQPLDGANWTEQANELVTSLTDGKFIQVELLGYNQLDGVPMVDVYVLDENKQTVRIDEQLLAQGLARPADPTLVARLPKFTTTTTSAAAALLSGGSVTPMAVSASCSASAAAVHSFAAAAATSAFGVGGGGRRKSTAAMDDEEDVDDHNQLSTPSTLTLMNCSSAAASDADTLVAMEC